MTYIAQLSDGSNTQFFPRTRWDALLNVPSLVQPSALKITRWNNAVTAKNGFSLSDKTYIERADFVNFSLLVFYTSWLGYPKLDAWKLVEAVAIPSSILNGYTKATGLSTRYRVNPTQDISLSDNLTALCTYPRQAIAAGTGTAIEMAYLIHN